ncbi:MAG: dihydrolipoamide dehydrogenase [Alphaproteobacteria bacterium]|nr:MAG: dihydrolipoamide dehydrogenase [Alphaproteobacteria bacterium]
MKEIKADICVIGAGSGGLTVASGAAQMGLSCVLIEKGAMGGDCLNTGCVPSKALLAAASYIEGAKKGPRYNQPELKAAPDFAGAMEHVASVIKKIEPHDSVERFEGLGVNVIKGAATFKDPHTVETEDTRVRAKKFVIATGSEPFVPPIEGLADTPYLTNETIFENREAPRHLIVIGGGPIGLEMAQAHRRLGAEVTVLEGKKILPKDDPEMVAILRVALAEEGVTLLEAASVSRVGGQAGSVTVTFSRDGGEETLEGSHILVATGRRPATSNLGLEVAGVELEGAAVKVDARLRTSQKHIFAIGDVIGGLQFTHVANYEAGIVIRNALFKLPAKVSYRAAPWVTYTDPPVGQVGMTEQIARQRHGDKIRILRSDFCENDRATAEKETEGFLKVIATSKGEILGASVVGKGAEEIINMWSLAMSAGLKMSAMASYISPYPTRGEISKRAAGAYFTPSLYSGKVRFLVKLLSKFG